jgi:predicted metal-dependent RNase
MSLIQKMPKRTFLVHGEREAATVFSQKIKEVYNWDAEIPKLHQKITLSL